MVNWLNLSQASGSGYELITVTAPSNTGMSRTTNLTVSGGSTSIVIPVLQYGQQDPGPTGYTGDYLTIEVVSGGTLIFGQRGNYVTTKYLKTIQYSLNNGAWTDWTSYADKVGQYYVPSSAATLNVSAGDVIRLRGNNSAYAYMVWTSTYPQGTAYALEIKNAGFFGTATFNVYGNILSLVYGDNYYGYNRITSPYTFSYLFNGSGVIDASNLIMPFTGATNACCYGMFYDCTELLSAPELPATTLSGPTHDPGGYSVSGHCYCQMFSKCTSLVNPPSVLPATAVTMWSYNSMFSECSAMTTAPVISATVVGSVSMGHMFDSCTSLLSAPDLLAQTADTRCYYRMFHGCSNLSSIKCMLTNVGSAVNPLGDWVAGVASAGTFTKSTNASFWTTGDSGIPNNWTIQNE